VTSILDYRGSGDTRQGGGGGERESCRRPWGVSSQVCETHDMHCDAKLDGASRGLDTPYR
jgi:hypothetical protein